MSYIRKCILKRFLIVIYSKTIEKPFRFQRSNLFSNQQTRATTKNKFSSPQFSQLLKLEINSSQPSCFNMDLGLIHVAACLRIKDDPFFWGKLRPFIFHRSVYYNLMFWSLYYFFIIPDIESKKLGQEKVSIFESSSFTADDV